MVKSVVAYGNAFTLATKVIDTSIFQSFNLETSARFAQPKLLAISDLNHSCETYTSILMHCHVVDCRYLKFVIKSKDNFLITCYFMQDWPFHDKLVFVQLDHFGN
jgi:hypothetical protein